jgi:hypothetical protein
LERYQDGVPRKKIIKSIMKRTIAPNKYSNESGKRKRLSYTAGLRGRNGIIAHSIEGALEEARLGRYGLLERYRRKAIG